MMRLYVFNPEHDIALASNLGNFTAPHAGRSLRHDIGFIPALWAEDGYVLVDDVEVAQKAYSRLMHEQYDNFVDKRMLSRITVDQVEPWGWDLALRSFLLRHGVPATAMPSEEQISAVRELSHRSYAVGLLRELQGPATVGQSWCAETLDEVECLVATQGRTVVKAPWSSSGRGIRFVDGELSEYHQRWVNNVIARQGSVVVEKYCDKVKDFGMEFESDGNGGARYLGLSLFHTQNGAYAGNILATEDEKLEMISRYVSKDTLMSVQQDICHRLGLLYRDRYKGPFGVDMMIVRGDNNVGFFLNPCVEINLRRTMGHVALSLANRFPSCSVMGLDFSEGRYHLRVRRR